LISQSKVWLAARSYDVPARPAANGCAQPVRGVNQVNQDDAA